MRIRRRAAIWIAAGTVVLSLAGATWRATRPDYLRKQLLALAQGALTEKWRIEIDSVDYSLLGGMARIEGIRLVRNDTNAAVVKIAKAEAEISFAALFGRGRLASEVRIYKPEITVERDADGRVPLFEAFQGGGGKAPSGHPRVQVTEGVFRILDHGALAEGESIVLALKSLTIEEARGDNSAPIAGELEEAGPPESTLGAIHLTGEFPPKKAGIRVVVDRFQVGEAMQKRLAPAIREHLSAFSHLAGAFGDKDAPALEVVFTADAFQATAHLRGLEFNLRDHPYEITGIAGDVTYTGRGASKRIDLTKFFLYHSGTSFQAAGFLDLSEPEAPFEVRFSASNLQLDKALYDAYPKNLQKVWDTYAFHGEVDIGSEADRGSGTLKSFLRRSKTGGPLEVDVTAQLVDAGLSFKGPLGEDGKRHGFDWPVVGCTGTVAVKVPADAAGGTFILLKDVRGKHKVKGEDTDVSAEGSVMEWSDRSKADILLKAENVPLDESVRDCSPLIAGLFKEYGARGRLSSLQVHIEQADVPGAPTLATVIGEFGGKGGMTWKEMPLAVDGIAGTVAYRERLLNGKKEMIVEITGVRGTAPDGAAVFADGTIEGEGEKSRIHLRVRADTILLDGPLQDAVEKGSVDVARNLWKNMKPSGPADLVVDVMGSGKHPDQAVNLTLRGSYLEGWGEVRFPVAGLTGTVELKGGSLDLHSVRGLHDGREVTLTGGGKITDDRTLLDLTLATTGFPLDDRARPILGPTLAEKMEGYFRTVRPKAGLEGDVAIRLQGPGGALEPTVTVEGLRGGAAPFDLKDLVFEGGRVRYADGTIAIQDLVGRMGDRQLRIPSGGLRFDRGEGNLVLEVRRLNFPGDLVGLIPAETAASLESILPDRLIHFEGLQVSLSEDWRRVEMSGAVSLRPRKEGGTGGLNLEGAFLLDRFALVRGPAEGDPTEVSGGMDITRGSFEAGVGVHDLSGRLDLRGGFGSPDRGIEGTLSGVRARVAGRELQDAGGEIGLKDGEFLVRGFRGTLAGGDVGLTVGVGGQRAIEGRVTLSNARAREFFSPADPDSPVRGQVEATISFRKSREPDAVIEGDGRMDIKNGKLFEVPVFNDISRLVAGLPFVKSSGPPEFTGGRLVFHIKGEKLAFEEVELDSPIVAIHRASGKSAAYVDGRLDLKLRLEVKTEGVLLLPLQWATTLVSPILGGLTSFYVRGTVQRPEASWINPDLLGGNFEDGPMFTPPPPAFPVEPRAPWDF